MSTLAVATRRASHSYRRPCLIAEPTDLDNLLSVAAAIIDHQGRLIAANPGFLHLSI